MDIRQVIAGEKVQPNQNLINPAKVRNVGSRRKPEFYKSIGISILGILSAFAVGYSYYGYLVNGFSLWFTFAALVCFSVLSILEAMLEKSWGRRMLMLLFETIALFIPFYASNLLLIAGAALVFFLFLLWGYQTSRSELNHGVEIQFFKVTHGVAAKLTTGLLLVLVLFYVLAQGGHGMVFVSENAFDSFFTWTMGTFESFYPAIIVSGSFHDFAASIAEAQLQHNPAFEALSPDEQVQAFQQATNQLTDNFSKNLGVTITPTSTVSAVIYGFIINFLRDWQNQYPEWFGIGQGIVLFLILRSLGVLFIWLMQFLSLLCYEGLIAAGLIGVIQEPYTREVVNFL